MGLYETTEEEKKKILHISNQMKLAGIKSELIDEIRVVASKYQGAFNLLELWLEADDQEKGRILDQLIEEVEEYRSMPDKPTFVPKET